MADVQFSFPKFIEDSKNVLISPKSYFSSMSKEGGFAEPLIKALIYGVIAGVVAMLWAVIGIGAVAGPMGSMIGGGIGVMALVGSIIAALIGLFIGAVIILVISAIAKGSTDFESCVRVTASLMVLMPINAIIGVTAGLPLFVSSIISLAVMLYGLYMMYHGVTAALGGDAGTAKIISIVLAIIPTLMLLSAVMCASAVKTGSEKWLQQSGQMMEQKAPEMQQTLKQLEEMAKQFEQQAKEAEKE